MGLHEICSRAQRMTTSMKATINGRTCAMVPEKRDSLERNVIFCAKQECIRPAAKMRLKRVLIDMCIESMIKERLKEKM
jgi:hypothetical protein